MQKNPTWLSSFPQTKFLAHRACSRHPLASAVGHSDLPDLPEAARCGDTLFGLQEQQQQQEQHPSDPLYSLPNLPTRQLGEEDPEGREGGASVVAACGSGGGVALAVGCSDGKVGKSIAHHGPLMNLEFYRSTFGATEV